MGIFSRLKSHRKAKNFVYPGETHPFILGEDVESADNNALKLSAVYAAINTISDTMSKIPFSVIDRKTKEKIVNENLYTILNVLPNPKMNASVLHRLMWNWGLYKGNGYALIVRKPHSTEIKEIIPIAPSSVNPKITIDNKLIYDVTIDNGTRRYRYDEIIHLKEFTLDGIHGISPLDYAMYTTGAGLNQEKWLDNFYQNYCRPLDYLKTTTDLSSRKVERTVIDKDGKEKKEQVSLKELMREEWIKAHSGDKKFMTAILDNGLEYGTVPQLTVEQLDFVNSKDINIQDIARFFGMGSCMFKLGVGKQTYSSNEQGQICYINETIASRLRQWEQELTLKLLTEEQRSKGWVIKGNLNAELRGDTAARREWYKSMVQLSVMSPNEVRTLEDMPNREDGDHYYIGPNYVPVEQANTGVTAGEYTPNPINPDNEESNGDD